MTGPLLLPVLPHDKIKGWPRHHNASEIGYVDAAEAFSRAWPSDAHFAAYSVPWVCRRLTMDAVGGLTAGWPMVLLVIDVDHLWKKEKPTTPEATEAKRERIREWWADELHKLAALESVHPGAFVYRSRSGGYRIVFRLASPFVIRTVDDKEAWRERYRRELLYLARRWGIVGDPACADITRLYRLPFVTPEGGPPTAPELRGDPAALGTWGHEPSAAELPDDIAMARALATMKPTDWSPVLRALAPERGGQEGQGAAPELRPEDQDEERLHKRAAAYLASMAPSVAGAGGNATLWAAALAMVRGFNLGAETGANLLERDFNPRCSPPWPRAEIERTCRNAADRGEQAWGYLRDAEGGERGLDHKPSQRRQQPPRQRPPTNTEGAPMPAEHDHDQADEGQGPSPSEAPPSWRAELQQDRSGYRKNLANVALILSRSPEWAGCLAYDEFADKIALLRCPPSHAHMASERFPRAWEDADDVHTARWLQTEWKIDAGPDLVGQAIVAVAREQRIHPVRDYLDGLTWDGTPRLERWLTTYLGARETIYSRTVGPMMLRAAVARVLFPGCKVDTMLVLQGLQDLGKSTAIKILCGEEWFTDELADFGSKDAAMQLLGVWLIEVSEMDSYGRAGVERVKGFVSRTTDRYRAAYGRHVRKQPRQCVFFGTTNADTYLRDETGNRRFWPVLCGAVGGVDLAGLARDRDQLWAEASAQVNAGLRWHLDRVKDAEALKMAKAAQGAVQERDAWENVVASYLADKDRVFVEMILSEALGLGVERWGRPEQMRVAAILKRAGWTRHYLTSEAGARAWGYLAPYPSSPQPPGHVPTSGSGEVGSGGLDQNPQPGEATGSNRAEGANGFLRVPGENAGDSTPPSTEEDSRHSTVQVSETVGTVGTVGTESQNSGPKADPTSLIEVGTVGTSTPLGELIRVLQEAPYVSLPFQVAQAEAERRLSPLSSRALPPGTDRTALEAAYQEARARSERDRGPTPTPPPASGVKAPAANDPAPVPPADLAAGDEEGWEPLE